MDKHINNKHILMAAAVAAVLGVASCSQDGLQSGAELPNDGRIMFTTGVSDNIEVTRAAVNASVRPIELKGGPRQLWLVPTVEPTVTEDRPSTRGTQLNRTDKLSSFGVSAFKHNAETYDLATCTPDYFYNLEATEIASSDPVQYQIAQNYYWPKADEALTFNAYYPYGNDNVELTDLKETAKAPGEQSFTVQIDGNAKNHVDFMTARAEATTAFNATAKPSVNLAFQHHMTAVRFVLGDQFVGGFIKNIAISGIYSKGTYTINSGWVATQKSAVSISYEKADNTIDKEVSGTPGETVTDGTKSETFLLIPQTFGASAEGEEAETAKISILYHDGQGDCLVEASLAGQDAWQEGTTVTYAISSKALSTLRISTIDFPTTVEGAPKTNWEAGDAVGLYVVSDGSNIIHKNVKCEYVGGTGTWKWRVVQPVVDGVEQTVYYDKDYDYYFYYPYKEGTPSGYPLVGQGKNAAAETFFSSVINSRNSSSSDDYADQSDYDKFNAADLQVAHAAKADNFSTITASMARQVGLTRLELKTVNILTDSTMLNNVKQETARTAVTATAQFNGNTPCQNGDYYYFYAKTTGTTSFNSVTGLDDSWGQSVNFTQLAAGETSPIQKAYSKRGSWTYINSIIYDYNGQKNVLEFKAPVTGNWHLEAWGAAGYRSAAAKGGGYAHGYKSMTASQTLYVCVGTQPTDETTGGYNGGGNAGNSGSAGGGATHIAVTTNRGVLKNYASTYKTEILLVAGGGGGSDSGDGGTGGGTNGGNGTPYHGYSSGTGWNGTGGSQTAAGGPNKGGFGYGGNATYPGSTGDFGGAGGGGLYGGGGCTEAAGGGGGGSGYVNPTYLTGTGMSNGGHPGDGRVRITLTRQ